MIKNLRKEAPFHIMLVPSVLLLFIYSYIPIVGGIVISFKKYMPALGFAKSKWVGLDNFIYIFTTPDFNRAFFNTLYIASIKIVAGTVVSIVFALLLNEVGVTFVKRSFQTIVYLPYFVSWVLLSGIIIDILSPSNGIINQFLELFGLEPIFFLGSNEWFPSVLVITHIWKEFGWGTIIYLAAITGIDPTLYEVSVVDGAGRWKQTLHITLPGMLPTIVLISTLNLGNILNAGFDQVFNLYSPVVLQSGDIIDTLVYRLGIEGTQFSIATTAGLFKSIISCILIITSYKLAYRFAGYKIF